MIVMLGEIRHQSILTLQLGKEPIELMEERTPHGTLLLLLLKRRRQGVRKRQVGIRKIVERRRRRDAISVALWARRHQEGMRSAATQY